MRRSVDGPTEATPKGIKEHRRRHTVYRSIAQVCSVGHQEEKKEKRAKQQESSRSRRVTGFFFSRKKREKGGKKRAQGVFKRKKWKKGKKGDMSCCVVADRVPLPFESGERDRASDRDDAVSIVERRQHRVAVPVAGNDVASLSAWLQDVTAQRLVGPVAEWASPSERDNTLLLLQMLAVGANLMPPYDPAIAHRRDHEARIESKEDADGHPPTRDVSIDETSAHCGADGLGVGEAGGSDTSDHAADVALVCMALLFPDVVEIYVPFWAALEAVDDVVPGTVAHVPWPPTPLSVYLFVTNGADGALARLARGVRFSAPHDMERAYGLAAAAWDMIAAHVIEPRVPPSPPAPALAPPIPIRHASDVPTQTDNGAKADASADVDEAKEREQGGNVGSRQKCDCNSTWAYDTDLHAYHVYEDNEDSDESTDSDGIGDDGDNSRDGNDSENDSDGSGSDEDGWGEAATRPRPANRSQSFADLSAALDCDAQNASDNDRRKRDRAQRDDDGRYRLVVTRESGIDAPWVAYLDDPHGRCVGALYARIDSRPNASQEKKDARASSETRDADASRADVPPRECDGFARPLPRPPPYVAVIDPTDGVCRLDQGADDDDDGDDRNDNDDDEGGGQEPRTGALRAHIVTAGQPTFMHRMDGVAFAYAGRNARDLDRCLSAPDALYAIRRSMSPEHYRWPTAVCALLFAAMDAVASCELDLCPIDLWPVEAGRCEALVRPQKLASALATRYDSVRDSPQDGAKHGATVSADRDGIRPLQTPCGDANGSIEDD